jgi:hypothetical protein
MPDLLVNLLRLTSIETVLPVMAEAHVVVRRARPFDITRVRTFVEREFSTAVICSISKFEHLAGLPLEVLIAATPTS